jgi:hypothetical protein
MRAGDQQLGRCQCRNPRQRARAGTLQAPTRSQRDTTCLHGKQDFLLALRGSCLGGLSVRAPATGEPIEESHAQPAMKRSRDWLKLLACSEAF